MSVTHNRSRSNTSHIHFGRRLLPSEDAAVLPNVLWLGVFDVHLSSLPLQCHLISSRMIKLVLPLPPLDRHPGPGQLTSKYHVASFRCLLVLQTQLEGEGDRCVEESDSRSKKSLSVY